MSSFLRMQAEGKSRCILILAGVDAQVLLDPLEEQLHLPMRLQVGDDKSAVATRSLGQEETKKRQYSASEERTLRSAAG